MKYILLFSLFFASSFSLAEENSNTATEQTEAQVLYDRGQMHILKFLFPETEEQRAIEKIQKGFLLLEESARLGHAEAQILLGFLYVSGYVAVAFRGIELEEEEILNDPDRAEDIRRAEHWLEKAAKQGAPKIQYGVGEMYKSLYDLSRNLKHKNRALHWLKKSADQGNQDAKDLMKYIINSEDEE